MFFLVLGDVLCDDLAGRTLLVGFHVPHQPFILFRAHSFTTGHRGKIRPFGKTEKSLGDVLLPKGMVDDLWLWKQECPDSSPDAFIFPNTDGGFMDTGNYRNRTLTPLAEKLGLPKLNFQVLRRTMATLAQGKGSVKHIQAHLRHSKADTTANEYMQELPESVGRMVESMYEELMHGQAAASADLLPNATNEDGGLPLCV